MSSKTGSQAVERALRLLKLFSDQQSTLTVNEAVKATNLNRTTVFRLLNALTNEGFLRRQPNGAYALGAELTALGGYALRNNTLWQVAHPAMEALSDVLNERVTLEVLSTAPDGTPAMLVMDEISADHVVNIREFAGNHLPMHATSTGKAMLAFVSDGVRQDILVRSTLTKLTDKTKLSETLSAELDQIRQQGHAIANEELEDGLIAIAVPLFDALNEPCAAISVAAPAVRINKAKCQVILRELKETGRNISEKLGHRLRPS